MPKTSINTCILYAEDDENDAFLMKHAFKQANVESPLRIVSSGQEAIDYLRGTGPFADRSCFPFPALLLLDLKMPQVTGMEVLEWIRQQEELCALVVIMYTSSHYESDIERAYELGVNSFVVKPAALAQIIEFVNVLKAWWLDHNQFAPCRREAVARVQ